MSHTYSTDSSERRYVPFFLAVAAIGASFLLSKILETYRVVFPWWLSPPVDVMAFYAFFYMIFDRYLWKWKVLHFLRIVSIPNLSGKWRGQVIPTPTDGISAGLGVPTDIEVSIRQTWATLLVLARTPQSNSHSISGAITICDRTTLNYQYINEPSAAAPATMHSHHGTVSVIFDQTNNRLDGEYYSGRDRQNIGTFRISRDA